MKKDLLNLNQIPQSACWRSTQCTIPQILVHQSLPTVKKNALNWLSARALPSGASISKETDASSDERGTGEQIQISTLAIPTPLVTFQAAVLVLRVLQASFFYLFESVQ